MIHIENTTYIDSESLEFRKTDVWAEAGPEGKLYFEKPQTTQTIQTIDCTGQFVTKSFVIGHHHIYSALAKGMPTPKKSPTNFNEILEYIWWTLDKSLDADMIKACAYVAAIESAKAGSSFIIDHHASPNFIDGSLDIIAEAFEEVGLSHLLCYEITDRDGPDKAKQGLAETERYIEQNQALVGLHASFTVNESSMQKAAELMKKYDSGVHIHVAEDKFDEKHSIKNYGKTVVERLNDYGLLNSSKTIIGHALHINAKERELLKQSPAWIVQNTESNLNNNVGFFNSEGLSNKIMLGTDGMHSDLLRSAQAAFFTGQAFDNIDFPEAYRRFRNSHNYLKENKFAGDGENNLVVLNYKSGTPLNSENFLGHFIFGLRPHHIQHLISDGNLIMKDRKLITVDEQKILGFAQEQAKRLWGRLKQ
ncbi:MAG: amidohydrolase family protein [Bacteroidota bacterium]|nr:amidohydrolase family protein [Bacteroidota bacterium]